MSEWKTVRLGDLCSKIGSGATPAGGKSAYCDEGISLIRSQNVLDMSFSVDGLAHINDTQAKKLDGVTVREGDVLLNITGDSVARCCSVPSYVLPARVNQHVCIIRASTASPKYIEYYLISIKQHLLTLAAAGATRNALTKETIQNLEIQLPDLPTQRRIAAVLGALDDKIENNRKICENLEAQAQALFKSWFVDFEPWGGKMPEEWKKGKLGDLAECNPFRRLPKGVDARCVEMADLVTNGAFPSGWSTKKYTGGMKFRNGDTIVARITPCFENGKAAFINFLEEDEVGFGSTEYVVISSCSAAPGGLFYSLVKSPDFITYAKSRMVGSSGRQRFNAEDVASFPLTIAPNNVYLELAPYYESIMEKIAQCGKESRALAEMRDALLPQLMSGRLRVDATACQGEIDVGKVEI